MQNRLQTILIKFSTSFIVPRSIHEYFAKTLIYISEPLNPIYPSHPFALLNLKNLWSKIPVDWLREQRKSEQLTGASKRQRHARASLATLSIGEGGGGRCTRAHTCTRTRAGDDERKREKREKGRDREKTERAAPLRIVTTPVSIHVLYTPARVTRTSAWVSGGPRGVDIYLYPCRREALTRGGKGIAAALDITWPILAIYQLRGGSFFLSARDFRPARYFEEKPCAAGRGRSVGIKCRGELIERTFLQHA